MQNNDNKVSKVSVDYQNTPKDNKHSCVNCTMFRQPNSCDAVAGTINVNGWCNLYAGNKGGR